MTQQTHAPTPWIVMNDSADVQRRIQDANGDIFAEIFTGNDQEDEAVAALIVKTVNSFEADQAKIKKLVEALENTYMALGRSGANIHLYHAGRGAWENARAIIAECKGDA